LKLSHLKDKDVTEFTALPERRAQDKGMEGMRKEGEEQRMKI
jgi:hypothetical protein